MDTERLHMIELGGIMSGRPRSENMVDQATSTKIGRLRIPSTSPTSTPPAISSLPGAAPISVSTSVPSAITPPASLASAEPAQHALASPTTLEDVNDLLDMTYRWQQLGEYEKEHVEQHMKSKGLEKLWTLIETYEDYAGTINVDLEKKTNDLESEEERSSALRRDIMSLKEKLNAAVAKAKEGSKLKFDALIELGEALKAVDDWEEYNKQFEDEDDEAFEEEFVEDKKQKDPEGDTAEEDDSAEWEDAVEEDDPTE
ncbi:hypothetical protein K491DRAFT_784703 [Lophiostoma macrostomum CBS 122681]|uniref:Uncharacterized protein n=1 Tax=Lophiostoma macrostomum CBS 122681 TaxID=1314788 RepID=A0A6A6SJ91_9PLEO|nr:hypothetical protein K491DRAFT_784703 [Lophiostoma macrostomum CBS 122681]